MQKRHECVCALRSTVARLPLTHPPVRVELRGVGAPHVFRSVSGPDWEDDSRALLHERARQDAVARCYPERDGDGRVEPEYLATDGMEVRAMIQQLVGDWILGIG